MNGSKVVAPKPSSWWSPGKIYVAIFGGALALDSIASVWGERRPIGGFFEELIARSGYYIVVFGALFGAVLAGVKTRERFDSGFLSWTVGIALFLAIGLGGMLLLSSIPGVDWRFERFQDSRGSDY